MPKFSQTAGQDEQQSGEHMYEIIKQLNIAFGGKDLRNGNPG